MKTSKSIFSVFGGTGNLNYNKLMPAFYQLFKENKLSKHVRIVAIGRRDKSSATFHDEIEAIIEKKMKSYSKELFDNFKTQVVYYKMDFSNASEFDDYKRYLEDIDVKYGTQGNRVFYLATAPKFFPEISENLQKYSLLDGDGYKRAVFEKPFGYDLDSAREINKRISKVFGEENIYRIDHYLGKEMIQNINTLRFSNQLFSAVWNNRSIDNVQISVKENALVKERGGYYDQSGALRDMVQNHLLQILAFVAMEPPVLCDPNSIRTEKVNVFKNIQINKEDVVFGQYEGYRQEDKVDKNSTTDTFVALKCEINADRWQGVPFYLRTGKALNSREAEIIIELKKESCCEQFEENVEPNLLVIKIQPEEGIYFRFNTKEPSNEGKITTVSMDYCQSCYIAYRSPEAYERLLGDIVNGDSTLFTRWDEVENAWKIIEELISSIGDKGELIHVYEKNSEGPLAATTLLKNSGRKWWALEDLSKGYFSVLGGGN